MHVHGLGAGLVRGERLGRQLIRGHRQVRVLAGSASAVDARLDVGLGFGRHGYIFALRDGPFRSSVLRMQGHTIVCGDDPLGLRIIEELQNAGIDVVVVATAEGLAAAGVADATAVICADDDDDLNLQIALLARQLSPTVRVVARLANTVLREAMALSNGPGAILDVADLAAPLVVEACLARTTHAISAAGIEFVISGTDAPRDATLRDMYGDLAPVAVIRGANSPSPGEVVACPGRDLQVHEGDSTAMIGTADELAAQGITIPKPLARTTASRPSWISRTMTAFRVMRDDINPLFYRVLAGAATLLIGSSVLLRFTYHDPDRPMSWVDALYFTASTVATVGYGDFSFIDQHTWLRLWSIGLIFAGLMTTAILVAFVADLLLSRRFVQSAGRRQVRHLRDHIIVVGLGSFGIRVVSDLKAAGHDVAVIERSEDNRYLSVAAELDVPVIFGDAKLRQTLESARLDEARAVALLTQDDMVNIETAIVLREMLGPRVLPELNRPDVPIVLRCTTARWGPPSVSGSASNTSAPRSSLPRRGSSARRWACRCSGRSRWANAHSWSAACTSNRRASWMASEWRTCRLKPASSQSSDPAHPRACIRGVTPV